MSYSGCSFNYTPSSNYYAEDTPSDLVRTAITKRRKFLSHPDRTIQELQSFMDNNFFTMSCISNLIINRRPKEDWDVLMTTLMCLPNNLKNNTIEELKTLMKAEPDVNIPDEYKILIKCI